MPSAPIPADENERLRELAALELLDSPPEPEFDELVELAARVCDTPIALLSLVDRDRQWFKARLGIDASETPREVSFCAHAILDGGIFEVPDAADDPRFADNPLVLGPPHIRFYAGFVLETEAGRRLGTLCVAAPEPRAVGPELRGALTTLGHAARTLIHVRSQRQRERALLAEYRTLAADRDRKASILEEVTQAQQLFLTRGPVQEVFEILLGAVIDASESAFGVIAERQPGADDREGLVIKAFTHSAWEPAARASYQKRLDDGLLVPTLDNLFGAIVATASPVVANDPAVDPRRGRGVPEGHPTVDAFLGLPCVVDGEVVGVIGVANRPGGYDARVIDDLDLLRSACTSLFANLRLQRRSAAAEAERRRSDSHLRALVESANDAIIGIDPAGRVLTWNPGAARLLGWSEGEARGRYFAELVDPASAQPGLAGLLERGLASGVPFELAAVDRDGHAIHLDASISRVDLDDAWTLSAILRDARPRKAAERALIERSDELAHSAAALAEALRIKDEFLATVSHELRTPLQGVIGLSTSLVAGHYGALAPTQSTVARTITASGETLLRLINDLLDLTRIETAQLSLLPAITDVTHLIDECIDALHEAAQRKSLVMRRDVAPDMPLLEIDPLRVRQVLLGLIGNAIKFTPSGAIEVRASLDPGGRRLQLAVQDTGIGIPADARATIFEPFTQLDHGARRHHAGAGLGLTLVRRLVEVMGGAVEVESEVGRGSTFTVTLPLQPPTELASAVAPAPARPGPRRILLAEDNEVNVMTIAAFLEAAGHDVAIAGDGREALTRARDFAPDLIFMDIHMPDLDGIEATRQIRADPSLRGLPIVALTATAGAAERQRCIDAGVDGFLAKPVTPAQLDEAIATFAGREHTTRDSP